MNRAHSSWPNAPKSRRVYRFHSSTFLPWHLQSTHVSKEAGLLWGIQPSKRGRGRAGELASCCPGVQSPDPIHHQPREGRKVPDGGGEATVAKDGESRIKLPERKELKSLEPRFPSLQDDDITSSQVLIDGASRTHSTAAGSQQALSKWQKCPYHDE